MDIQDPTLNLIHVKMNKGSESYMYYRFPESFYLDIEVRNDLDIESFTDESSYRNTESIEDIIDEEYADEIVSIM